VKDDNEREKVRGTDKLIADWSLRKREWGKICSGSKPYITGV
jgi:hypothetical protein